MRTNSNLRKQSLFNSAQALRTGILLLICALAMQGAVVTELTEAALREAIAGGGTVTFAVDGTIPLASTIVITGDVVLDATGHQVTISGGQSVGVFRVNPAVHFGAMNLAIANSRATNGGALYNDGGTVDLVGAILTGNVATNANGLSCGGAIFNASGTINATRCTFALNVASGGTPGSYNYGANGLNGWGAATFNLGSLNVAGCSFVQNSATGGTGMWGSSGLPYGGTGGSGGSAMGGAIYSVGPLTLNATLIASNIVVGGTGGMGGGGMSAGCAAGYGGAGGTGGNAYGAGLYATGVVAVVNCTFAHNNAVAGLGGPGGYGQNGFCHGIIIPGVPGAPGVMGSALGGINLTQSQSAFTNCTVAFNHGGGIRNVSGTASLVNTLLCSNEPSGNGIGSLIDSGHNLSSDASCAFTNASSMNNTDPLLASLANNGGPTWTMALQPGSPAIDAGDTTVAPATDQRGYLRSAGATADIGAFEFAALPPVPVLTMVQTGSSTFEVRCAWAGGTNQTCRLLLSADMLGWNPCATNQFDTNGTVVFGVAYDPAAAPRFYRLSVP